MPPTALARGRYSVTLAEGPSTDGEGDANAFGQEREASTTETSLFTSQAGESEREGCLMGSEALEHRCHDCVLEEPPWKEPGQEVSKALKTWLPLGTAANASSEVTWKQSCKNAKR